MAIDRGAGMDIPNGAPIYTQDGSQIGSVKEVQGQFIKVDAPMQTDYWLSTEIVRSAAGGQVTLAIDQDRVDDYKLDHPMTAADTINTENGVYPPKRVPDMANDIPGTMRSNTIVPLTNEPPDYRPDMVEGETRPWGESAPRYQQDWERRHGASGQRWTEVEPVYRCVYELSQEPRFRGRSFTEVEPELRVSYAVWAERNGYPYDAAAWDRQRATVEEAWESMCGAGNRRLEELKAHDAERPAERKSARTSRPLQS